MGGLSVSAPELARIAEALVTIASMYANNVQRRRLAGWLHSPVVIRDAFNWAVARVEELFDDALLVMSDAIDASRDVPVEHGDWAGPCAKLYCDLALDESGLDESEPPGDAIQFRVQIFFTQKRLYIGRYEIFPLMSNVGMVLGTAGPMCDFTLAVADCYVILLPGFDDEDADDAFHDITAIHSGLVATGAAIPRLSRFIHVLRDAVDALH